VAEQHSQPDAHANEAASTSGETQATSAATAGGGEPRQGSLALRMGTFHVPENAARTVELLRNAGYPAYSSPVVLPSGRTATGVFLGPYTERADAERDLRSATRNSEYADGHLVRVQRRR
jgi:cell division septation protein DedD